ncbi:DNA polymerase III subunit gamma/tau [Thermodesulforhabdus norvegica]|uniref:DNA polymerase III subunit gamma/tau n=1 Tax=Thermodesulforhabdus norvegica TaxID=39841 RepID=A0A1I4TT87_9BACT|nr:DNA polymerase III subunit gamma/tau [Thermodesulforhabdus norvegica]SFM79919.1 DNA polymerase III, tau subunit [Thermodesulforhabdus norvegica]
MSYIVLARRWRPQSFKEVVGQSHVTRILQNALSTGRIAHAYIFAGPRGVGKTSVARILAKALNCTERNGSEPCNSCPSCRSITAGKSPDVIEIDGASNRGIDSIRSLQETVAYRPITGKYKVYIIDEVHMLTPEAFNALLKTLEEPPSHVRFIFATTEPHRIPSTVVSRCQRFDFRRIPVRDITEHLSSICRTEGYDVASDVIEAIAGEADGSMRDAETLLEQVVSFQDENLRPEEILNLLGIVDRSTLIRAMDAVISANFEECIAVASDVYERGLDCAKFCQRLVDLCHHLACFIIAGRSGRVTSDEMTPILQKWTDRTSLQTVQIYYELLIRAMDQIRRSSQPHLVLEAALLRLAQVPHFVMLPEIIKNLETRRPGAEKPQPGAFREKHPALAESAESESKKVLDIRPESPSGNPEKDWHKFVSWAAKQDPLLETQLKGSYVDTSKETIWTIHVLSAYAEVLKRKENNILELLSRFFSSPPEKILLEAHDGNNRADNGKGSFNDKKEIERRALNHPAVKEVLEIFGGRIVAVRPLKKPAQRPGMMNHDDEEKGDSLITGGVDEDL